MTTAVLLAHHEVLLLGEPAVAAALGAGVVFLRGLVQRLDRRRRRG